MTVQTDTFCPDCGHLIPTDTFVEHRALEHPPRPRVLAAPGIQSQVRFGTDPPKENS